MNESRFRGILAGVVACAALISVPANAATTLSVVNAAQIGGSAFGMRVTFGAGTQNAFVQSNEAACELNYYATWSMRNLNMTMVANDTHQVLRGLSNTPAPNTPAFRVQVKRSAGGTDFILFVWARLDSGAFTAPIQTFVNNQNRLTIEWHRSTGVDTNDGSIKLFKGTTAIGTVSGIDNDQVCIDTAQMGAFGGVDVATTGTQDFDEFVSTRAAQF